MMYLVGECDLEIFSLYNTTFRVDIFLSICLCFFILSKIKTVVLEWNETQLIVNCGSPPFNWWSFLGPGKCFHSIPVSVTPNCDTCLFYRGGRELTSCNPCWLHTFPIQTTRIVAHCRHTYRLRNGGHGYIYINSHRHMDHSGTPESPNK